MTNKDEVMESTDQPKEESTTEEVVEQSQEESQDQPDLESQEGEAEEAVEEVELSDGSKVPLDELKKGYMRTSDYTRKTQELKRKQEEILADVKPGTPDDSLSKEEKAAMETLDKLGVARKQDVESTVQRILAQQSMLSEKSKVQAETGLDNDTMEIAQFMAFKKKIPLTKAAEILQNSGKKVVKRKGLSPSSDVTTSASGKVGQQITPEYIKTLDPNSKEFAEVVDMYDKGEL